jgi:DNA-binding Lrp family transcriptional regulator
MDMNVTPHPALQDTLNRALLQAVERGLPLVLQPYAFIGAQLGIGEDEVIARLQNLQDQGIIKRMGVVVRHALRNAVLPPRPAFAGLAL